MGPGHGTPDVSGLPSTNTVVDVGGGTGALLAEVLRANPGATGILVDLPRPVAKSRAVFEAAGVAARATVQAQSFFDPLPAGADLYLLKSVLADWPDREATAILRRCAEAAHPAGSVVVFTQTESLPSLLMMVLVGGKDRSPDELRHLALQAGLEQLAVTRQQSGRVLVEFRPAG